MAYNVNSYFIFLPTVALLYQLVKKERRWWVLLGASVVFFWLISRQLILWAVVTAGITYSIAGWIDRTQVQIKAIDRSEKERRNALKEKSRKILQMGLLGTVGILVALKYTAFTVETTMQVVRHFGGNGNFSVGRILVPIGISFYTLQAVSYLLDVYWKREKAESNFFKLFLFLIFFPTVMEGPILQWSDTKDTLYSGEPIQGENLGLGCFRIIWGLFKRMIVSDRLNTAVLMLYRPEAHYSGFMIVLTAVITTIQLYLEFSGTHRYRYRIGADFRGEAAREFPPALQGQERRGVLAEMAHHLGTLVQKLYFLSGHHFFGGEEMGKVRTETLRKIHHHGGHQRDGSVPGVDAERTLARTEVAVHPVRSVLFHHSAGGSGIGTAGRENAAADSRVR